MRNVILTGDRPTGRLHVGHYVGSLRERVALQNSGTYDDIYIMIADAQALTDELASRYGDCDVEMQMGGQPLYYYLVSVE